MGRKRKLITEEEIPEAQVQQSAIPAPELSPEEVEISEYFGRMANTANKIRVYKIIDGRKCFCGAADPSEISEEFIQRKWGAGNYRLYCEFNNRIVPDGTRSLSIYEPPITDNKPALEIPRGQDPQLGFILDRLAQQDKLVMEMISKLGNQGDKTSLADILALARELAPKQPDVAALLPSLAGMITKFIELGKDAADHATGKDSWMSLVREGIKELPGMIKTIMPRHGNGAAPDVNPPAPAVNVEEILKSGISHLKRKAAKGSDPELQADLLIDSLDEEPYRTITLHLMNEPFERFVSIDPEINQEPLKSWFTKFYNSLKEGLSEYAKDNAMAGAGGGASDASGNEPVNG